MKIGKIRKCLKVMPALTLLCYACTKSGHTYDYIVEKNNHEFPVEENKKTGLVELDYPFRIEECMLHGGALLQNRDV